MGNVLEVLFPADLFKVTQYKRNCTHGIEPRSSVLLVCWGNPLRTCPRQLVRQLRSILKGRLKILYFENQDPSDNAFFIEMLMTLLLVLGLLAGCYEHGNDPMSLVAELLVAFHGPYWFSFYLMVCSICNRFTCHFPLAVIFSVANAYLLSMLV